MNKELVSDIKKAYATYRHLLVHDVLLVPMYFPNDVCIPTKITISGIPAKNSASKTSKAVFKVEKIGVIGEVELVKRNDTTEIVDITPSSLITVDEAQSFLGRQKNGVIRIGQVDGVELCTRGTSFHDDVSNVICGKHVPMISIKSLRGILGYMLSSTELSPRLLYALLAKMENDYDSVWTKLMAQYAKKGMLLGDSPIKTDKTVRAMRFCTENVSAAEEQDILYKLSGRCDTCLKDFLAENSKDREAADKYRMKSGAGRINCYQTLMTAAIKRYDGAFSHRDYR